METFNLNERALRVAEELIARARELRCTVQINGAGTTVIDAGVEATGGLAAGRLVAIACTARLAEISLIPAGHAPSGGPAVMVQTDQPLAACLGAQYAGWQLAHEKYFAMGSGPMRAVAAKEAMLQELGLSETADQVIGVLETSGSPPDELCKKIAADCGIPPERLTLIVARTASIAGAVQVVARSVETALHQLHELRFDLTRIVSAWGIAPLPPVAKTDVTAIGWTNDAVLYGAEVSLWVRGDDHSLVDAGQQVPSCSSRDYGAPFGEIFERFGRDFYRIDPKLFSPAQVTLINVDTGRTHRFGQTNPAVLKKSWGFPDQ
jgi:methenyltetrahydromethanopterin cyclohydrolase